MLKQSFPPIYSENAKFLILGSLPGDKSLKEEQYYAHPQNRFWKLVFKLMNTPFQHGYNERTQLLRDHHIALWDTCASAIRPGSMDNAILAEVPNDIIGLLERTPSIHTVLFNGNKARLLYDKYHRRVADITYHSLPSTSPANAQFSFERLLDTWSILKSG
ncbi:DNA-deoxyinosine glycosylase [Sphingobacterium sp. SYP-B4668]|uniref:DNA-deoxyinosine glycosylase n=1 Tax=Sphingobacterium sp. SYP-B4668 TaxID=2996035 RepID=UPI0022DDC91C|nr:DNA-deoxyinosine glycosylase [Sphingobacterium sp. SYP-B4668]